MPGMPGTVTDERSNLLAFVEQQAYVLSLTAYGLTDEQARARPTVSTLTVGGWSSTSPQWSVASPGASTAYRTTRRTAPRSSR